MYVSDDNKNDKMMMINIGHDNVDAMMMLPSANFYFLVRNEKITFSCPNWLSGMDGIDV